MTNKDIAKIFQRLADLMELHGENPFKIRSYQNAYLTLRKLDTPLVEMRRSDIDALKGVGKAIGDKIQELLNTGQLSTLERYRAITPPGVEELLNISGIGPKKIATIWRNLGIESPGELLYAVNENRLIELKGFGAKTQDDIRQKLEYYLRHQGQYQYATLEAEAQPLLQHLQALLPGTRVALVGPVARGCNVVDAMDLLMDSPTLPEALLSSDTLRILHPSAHPIDARTVSDLPVRIYLCRPEEFGSKLFRHIAAPEFLAAFTEAFPGTDFRNLSDEAEVFAKAGLPYIPPELRDLPNVINLAQTHQLPVLIEAHDIRGVIHAHTTYSDGLHTLRDMADYAFRLGYTYIGITDHSKTAVYAQGLPVERVLQQWREIDALNQEYAQAGEAFRILKGIESDILADGSLDYDACILAGFDFVIASVHSNLRMDEAKATQRLIKAIENPYTTILGHPTGRLLLSRPGYPIDHKAVIDACAANGVAIELNANPHRLDLDWSWIPYAMDKKVLIAINPDAHSKEGIKHIRYGVVSARKGGLNAEACLNTRDAKNFLEFAQARRRSKL